MVRSPTGEGSASNVAKVAINVDPVIIIASENITHTSTMNVDLTLIALGTLYFSEPHRFKAAVPLKPRFFRDRKLLPTGCTQSIVGYILINDPFPDEAQSVFVFGEDGDST